MCGYHIVAIVKQDEGRGHTGEEGQGGKGAAVGEVEVMGAEDGHDDDDDNEVTAVLLIVKRGWC